jgi:hypothetical protein
MLEICVHALEGLYQQLETISTEEHDPLARVKAILQVMLCFGFEQPTAYQLLYCVAPKEINERRNEVIAPLSRACFQRALQAVEAAVAAGKLRQDMPPKALTEALVASCHGLIGMRLANPYAPWSDPKLMSDVLLGGLFEGFGPQ